MRIGLIAPPWVPVPPTTYGGTEGVIDRLARGLVRAGHEVELFTVGTSTCPVPRQWRFRRPMSPINDSLVEAAHVLDAYDALTQVDVLHDHTMLGPVLARGQRLRVPLVSTLHGSFTPDTRRLFRATAGSVALVCVSRDQRASAPEIPVARVIHHGVDPEEFAPGAGDGGYLLFVGRMSPDKGVDRAIEVARAAGARLLIAAKMREPAERAYFEARVEPYLDAEIEYVGEVSVRERLDLLQGASALVNPIEWPEPFGLVMIEAMACGTPVIVRAVGAAPEIVLDGVTGALCSSTAQMVQAVARTDTFDRAACRRHVLAHFSTARMVADHVRLYEDVVRSGGQPADPAVAVRGAS